MLTAPKQKSDDRFPKWKPLLDARRADVLRIPGVMSVGIGGKSGDEHVVVLVERRSSATDKEIRTKLDGLTVEVKHSKPFIFF